MLSEQIKSFVIRNGRCGMQQNLSYMYSLCHYGITPYAQPWCFESIFGRQADTIVEIGFGMGQSLIQMACQHPEKNYVGIEVHRPGIGQLLSDIRRLEIKNIRVAAFDAMLAFRQCIPANSLSGIQIYFPDPWPKKRHFKRRLVQKTFVELLARTLLPRGYLHCATDWAPYAEWMLEEIAACHTLTNLSSSQTYVDRPEWRPMTKFEKRGVHLGHEVFDLLYLKMDSLS